MKMVSHLERLFAYDNWANREVLVSLQKQEKPPGPSIRLLAHVVSAQRLWFERLTAHPQTLPVWPSLTLAQCEEEAVDLYRRYQGYLRQRNEAALSEKVTYTNSAGKSFVNEAGDILMHVILHSIYHRGQIAADMRAAGLQPASTDFIFSIREGFVE
jgi:uncharacterized damage-inducible protein DinB